MVVFCRLEIIMGGGWIGKKVFEFNFNDELLVLHARSRPKP